MRNLKSLNKYQIRELLCRLQRRTPAQGVKSCLVSDPFLMTHAEAQHHLKNYDIPLHRNFDINSFRLKMSKSATHHITEILSHTRILPKILLETPQTVPLSIIDSTVAYYGPTTAIWFFERPSITRPFFDFTAELKNSLALRLSDFPHFAGSLHFTDHKQDGDHTQRYKRLAITYGQKTDPGVEFFVGKYEGSLESLIPSAAVRRGGNGCWDGTHVPVDDLIPSSTNLSLRDYESKDHSLPCIAIQATEFSCGGIAIAFRSSHAIADSISLVYFVNCWAKMNRDLQNQVFCPLPKPRPIFDPKLLDRAAAGDIDAPRPDPRLVNKALAMPMHRFDSWNQPAANGDSHSIPQEFDPASIELGDPPPKTGSDADVQISFCTLHFTHQEMENIWKAANTADAPVSHHDALCAHIWILINRSRGLENDEEDVHLNFTIGIRTRTSPKLPDTFLGSPTLIGDVAMKAREASDSLPKVASKIRSIIQQFTSENVSAVLHHRAFDETPQRYLHSSTGLRHAIQTSWMGNGMYDVDFGTKSRLRYGMAAMAMIDGFVQTMEAAPFETGETGSGKSDPGVDVAVRVAAKTMERLLADPLLRRYRD